MLHAACEREWSYFGIHINSPTSRTSLTNILFVPRQVPRTALCITITSILFLSKKVTNGSPVYSRDREIAVVNDENNNEVTTKDNDDGTGREGEMTKVATEEDVCENVNVREMRKFFIEQGRDFAIRVAFQLLSRVIEEFPISEK